MRFVSVLDLLLGYFCSSRLLSLMLAIKPTVVNHIRQFYKNPLTAGDPTIDLLISTHPDGDHIGGLLHVLQTLPIRELWIHQPWSHAAAIQR